MMVEGQAYHRRNIKGNKAKIMGREDIIRLIHNLFFRFFSQINKEFNSLVTEAKQCILGHFGVSKLVEYFTSLRRLQLRLKTGEIIQRKNRNACKGDRGKKWRRLKFKSGKLLSMSSKLF